MAGLGSLAGLGNLGLEARRLRMRGFNKGFKKKMAGLGSLARLGNLGLEARRLRI